MESRTTSVIFPDLCWWGVVFAASWAIYFAIYLISAKLRWVENVDRRLVLIGNLSALAGGILSWLLLRSDFSSPAAFWMATVTAPITFLGFCGTFILLGPVTVDRSITLAILSALKSVEDRELPNSKLIEVVPFDRIYQKRLKELSKSGVIELKGNTVKVTRKGEFALRIFLLIGHLLNVKQQ